MTPRSISLPREVEPEWLDLLAADDPRARRSRTDLRWLNAVMRNAALMARMLSAHGPPPRRILDLGCGDGTFMLSVARRLSPRWSGVTVRLLDRHAAVTDATRDSFAALGWRAEAVESDLAQFLAHDTADADLVTANLVLHHFGDAELPQLLRLISQRTPRFVACEPRRNRFALLSSRLVFALGCNKVTRHDAPASVRAGFGGAELSALWPDPNAWQLRENAAGLFGHGFEASRR